ncbi:MAG: penicillin-insensitive murein endopeptidase [Myxococcales bacterium]|nr:penicillin-insensitive murein endopeptidase [Myxococcales bacterium]
MVTARRVRARWRAPVFNPPRARLLARGSAAALATIAIATGLLLAPQPAAAGYCGPGREHLRHEVKSGETVGGIAAEYGVTVKSMVYNNPGLDPAKISVGQSLHVCVDKTSDKVPEKTSDKTSDKKSDKKSDKADKADKADKKSDSSSRRASEGCGKGFKRAVHEVRSGESLGAIASEYGTTEEVIKHDNPAVRKHPNMLRVGQELQVCVESRRAGKSKLCDYRSPVYTHEVIPGETASLIAARYGVRRQDLYRLNASLKRDPNNLRVGQTIRVCPDIAPRERVKLQHSVASGETFSDIAVSYGVTPSELEGYQRGHLKDRNKLRVGQELTVYKDGGIVPGFGAYEDDKGVLKSGVQLPPGRHYVVKHPTLSYGTSKTIRAIQSAISSYAGQAKGGPKIHVGDISKKGGGSFPPHVSHQHGRDVDVGYVLEGELADEIKFRSANKDNLDARRTWLLLKAFIDTGEVGHIFMSYSLQKLVYEYARKHGVSESTLDELFQYPRGRGRTAGIIRHWRGHSNHFHVRFRK